jgi:NADH:ubiquinone oxidoreductase subunit F (NADH-binding)
MDGTPSYHQVLLQQTVKDALRNCGFIDPDHIEEYIARGGYFSLYRALFEMSRRNHEEVKDQVSAGEEGWVSDRR